MTDNKSTIFIAIIISLIAGWLIGNYVIHIPRPQHITTVPLVVPEPSVSEKNIVQVTDTGFVPTTLRIKAGETVTFISKATAPVWPAGNPHPTHDAYPSRVYTVAGDQAKSFGSKACVEYGTRKGEVFDHCKLLLPEQTFTFRFSEQGSWSFHNHVRPEHTGTIIVE